MHSNGKKPSLELHLSRNVFVAGRQLSGVVVINVPKPTSFKSLQVSITGQETPEIRTFLRPIKKTSSFFHKEESLSGRTQAMLGSERISQLWNEFLGRDKGRVLSPGEHIYPFSIPLPAQLPPSYSGKAGKIEYVVNAHATMLMASSLSASTTVPVLSLPKPQKTHPVALGYPIVGGSIQESKVSLKVELPQRNALLGEMIEGRIMLSNPQKSDIRNISLTLESAEWIRSATEKKMQCKQLDAVEISPEPRDAEEIESKFKLHVPTDAVPSTEGSTISVLCLLKVTVNTNPPIEFRTPLSIYAPIPED